MEAIELVCSSCKHFNRADGGCAAFPDGIPDEITGGENEHSEPLPGQKNNIVYQEAKPSDEQQ